MTWPNEKTSLWTSGTCDLSAQGLWKRHSRGGTGVPWTGVTVVVQAVEEKVEAFGKRAASPFLSKS